MGNSQSEDPQLPEAKYPAEVPSTTGQNAGLNIINAILNTYMSPNNKSNALANMSISALQQERADRQNLTETSHLTPSSRLKRQYWQIFSHKKALEYLTLDHKEAVWAWTGNSYYHHLNRALRNDDEAGLLTYAYLIMSIRRFIRQTRTSNAMTLYRGTSITPDLAKNVYKVGASFLWPEFTASSVKKEVAQNFAKWKGHGYVLIITTPGVGTSYYSKIPPAWSHFPNEEEVLIYPYSGITVTNVDHSKREISVTLTDTLVVEKVAGVSLGSCTPSSAPWPCGKP